jgi:hypothetical protein
MAKEKQGKTAAINSGVEETHNLVAKAYMEGTLDEKVEQSYGKSKRSKS